MNLFSTIKAILGLSRDGGTQSAQPSRPPVYDFDTALAIATQREAARDREAEERYERRARDRFQKDEAKRRARLHARNLTNGDAPRRDDDAFQANTMLAATYIALSPSFHSAPTYSTPSHSHSDTHSSPSCDTSSSFSSSVDCGSSPSDGGGSF